jgi:hypothetical protein
LLIATSHRSCGDDFADQHSDTGRPTGSLFSDHSTFASVEYDMKMGSASLFGRLCCGLSMAVLTLAVSLDGSRSVRAEDADDLTSSLQEMIFVPIMKTVQGLEARVTGLEATVGAMSESFSSRRVVAQVLCVSDETGSQTCITKAQLDVLLSGIARAEISQPPVAATEAKAARAEEAVETIVTKDASQYSEQAAPVDEKSKAEQEPEHTGSIQAASSGVAIVLNPGIEVTEDPAPVEAVPAEPVAHSDD